MNLFYWFCSVAMFSGINRLLYVTNQGLGEAASVDLENVMLLKALVTARDILLEELQILSNAVDQAIEISEFVSKMNNGKILSSFVQASQFAADVEISAQGKPQNGLEVLTYIHAAENCYIYNIYIYIILFFYGFFFV